jgi:hypothetical protein
VSVVRPPKTAGLRDNSCHLRRGRGGQRHGLGAHARQPRPDSSMPQFQRRGRRNEWPERQGLHGRAEAGRHGCVDLAVVLAAPSAVHLVAQGIRSRFDERIVRDRYASWASRESTFNHHTHGTSTPFDRTKDSLDAIVRPESPPGIRAANLDARSVRIRDDRGAWIRLKSRNCRSLGAAHGAKPPRGTHDVTAANGRLFA